jgi:thiamine-monophosphate kinase
LLLARNRAATAAIDLSDGLADAALRVAEASGVGMTIDEDAVPVAEGADVWLEGGTADPVAAAAVAGDDYELLFTVPRRSGGRLRAAAQGAGVPLTRIGACTDRPGAVFLRRGAAERPMPEPGFHHFR